MNKSSESLKRLRDHDFCDFKPKLLRTGLPATRDYFWTWGLTDGKWNLSQRVSPYTTPWNRFGYYIDKKNTLILRPELAKSLLWELLPFNAYWVFFKGVWCSALLDSRGYGREDRLWLLYDRGASNDSKRLATLNGMEIDPEWVIPVPSGFCRTADGYMNRDEYALLCKLVSRSLDVVHE